MNLQLGEDGSYLLTWDGCTGFSVRSRGTWTAIGRKVEIGGGVAPIEDLFLRDLTVDDEGGTIALRSSIGAEFRRVVPCGGCDDGTLRICFSCGHLRCGTLGASLLGGMKRPWGRLARPGEGMKKESPLELDGAGDMGLALPLFVVSREVSLWLLPPMPASSF